MQSLDTQQPLFAKHLGIKVCEWDNGRIVLETKVKPEFCNNSGLPHGGFITTLIDMATGLAGTYCPIPNHIRRALTLSLNINFIGQSHNKTLKTVGKVTNSGWKVYFATGKVYDTAGVLLASGQAVYRYRSGSETLEGQPLDNEENPQMVQGVKGR